MTRRLHGDICSDLVPDWAGRWRNLAVIVDTHEPPSPYEIPLRMRDDDDDPALRLETLAERPDWLTEMLAFAEGRLLSIHPFRDFNGRVTRLCLPCPNSPPSRRI